MLSQNALTSSMHPLADRFSAEIEQHVANCTHEYELFCAEICGKYEFVWRYNVAYGPRIMYILFVLKRWLGTEIFLFSRLSLEHVALLIIQFGLGILKLSSDIRNTCKTRLLSQKLMWNERLEVIDHGISDIGLTLICFLRFLASQQFSMSSSVDLSLHDRRPIPYPILMRQPIWEPLHQMAFRTYHHIAVTGRFDSIYVSNITQNLGERESRFDGHLRYSLTSITLILNRCESPGKTIERVDSQV
uniref:Transmembrane protein n=1 Tax=Haemonchus contortus TaxID=6289 RepID=A0A7I4Z1W8_HAECO